MVNYNTHFKRREKKYKIMYGYHVDETPVCFVYSDELRRPVPVIIGKGLARQYGEFHNLEGWWWDNS